jgi:hypothetical protein
MSADVCSRQQNSWSLGDQELGTSGEFIMVYRNSHHSHSASETSSSRQTTSVHELQAKAFLVAAEDVDIDQEIIDDILSDLGHDKTAVSGDGDGVTDEDDDGSSLTEDDFEGELDISALYANALDGESILVTSIHLIIRSLLHILNP